jgi:hypothetical protein
VAFAVNFPVYVIISTIQWVSCFFTCRPEALDDLWEVIVEFIYNTWNVPYTWGSMIYAIIFNVLYWLYLVYLYIALVTWAFLERYLSWFFNIIGVTMGWAWSFTEWLVESTARTLYFMFKYTVIFGF